MADYLDSLGEGPTAADLAAIEAEWPLIAADLAAVEAEIRAAGSGAAPAGLAPRSVASLAHDERIAA